MCLCISSGSAASRAYRFSVSCWNFHTGLSVMEYDSARHTDYMQTLDVFLKNEMSISQTAADLFIHRNSLIKRLEKLKQLLNIDLESPDVRLYYRICLMEMIKHR